MLSLLLRIDGETNDKVLILVIICFVEFLVELWHIINSMLCIMETVSRFLVSIFLLWFIKIESIL
jgi:hypothetical protein